MADGAGAWRLRRTWQQRSIVAVGVLLASCSFASAAAVGFVRAKVAQVQRVSLTSGLAPAEDASQDSASPDAPVNVLVVGIDNVGALAEDDRRRIGRDDGIRSDTIILLRLEPATGRAAALSFPRDLWLPLGGDGGRERINAALPLGGPELLLQTITANFGIPVDHYVEVDFAQFRRLVNVVGGVPMPFDKPARDDNSGLYVGEAGCVMLDGDMALDYVRSRYLQVLEGGEWVADGGADLSRVRRQQDFLRRALRRAQAKGLDNPVTANRLIDVGLDALTVDATFEVSDIVRLARRFRGLDPGALLTFSLPTTFFETDDGASVLRLDEPDAEPVLDIFRGVDPDRPAAVAVSVSDASARAALTAPGFRVVATAATQPRSAATAVRFHAIDRYRADALARWLSAPPSLERVDDGDPLAAGVVELVVGADFAGVLPEPRPAPSYWKPAASTVGILPGEGRDDLCR